MNWKRKIAGFVIFSLFVTYLIVSTGFVDAKRREQICRKVQIVVYDSLVNSFIRPADISMIMEQEGWKTSGEYLYSLNIHQLEQLLNKRSVIRNTDVFTSIDGILHVNVYQRRPIIRLQALKGSFYIDETGYIFPLSGVYTSFVPVVTGNVPMNLPAGYRGSIPDKEKFLKQLYAFAVFLDKDEFWQSQIVQVNVRNASNVDLIPRVGRQTIHIGDLNTYEYKLKKLLAFYRNALSMETINHYSGFDLRYGNQVICVRK